MPALITHHLFGEKCVSELPDSIIEDQEQLLAFLLGNQGPDPFFFRFRGLPQDLSACHELAKRMHCERVALAFNSLRDSVGRLPLPDQKVGRAFALGMLGHYTLDLTTHPFIFAEQIEIIAQSNGELDGLDSQVHAIIEGRLDSWLLWRERHSTVLDCPPAYELCRTPRIDRVAGALFSQIAWQIYGISLPVEAYGACVNDMQTAYKLIEPAGSPKGEVLAVIEEPLRGTTSQIQAMAHDVLQTDDCPLANPGHLPWKSPATGKESTASFLDLFNLAVTDYGVLAQAFVKGGDDMEAAIDRLNYSGETY